MIILAVIASLFSAAFNAGASLLERLSVKAPALNALITGRQAVKTAVSKLFVLGFALQIGSYFAQAVALSQAPLVIVEPLLTMDLIFLLLLINRYLKVPITLENWLAVGAMIIGMSGMFIAARPEAGHLKYSLLPWLVTSAILIVIMAIGLLGVKRFRDPRWRAASGSLSAAMSFAMIAAFTKLALNQLSHGGFIYMLSNWPVYALAATGALSVYLLEMAYGSGPLAVTQPILEITEPVVSVLIGINLFGDVIHLSLLRVAIELIGIFLVIWGIVSLARSSRTHVIGVGAP